MSKWSDIVSDGGMDPRNKPEIKIPQDVEEFIAEYSQTEPIRDKYRNAYYEIDIIEVDDLRAWMAGYVRVPVGWQFYQDGKWWHGDDRIKDHRKNTEEAGFPVRDVYADPQPTTCIGCEGVPGPKNSPCAVCGQKSTPDVTALVEALECALETMENVDGENDCSRGIDAVEEALAAHRKGGAAAYCEPEEEPTALIPLSDYEALHAECEKLRKDAERYGYIREGNHWIVAATQTGVHLDGKNLDDLIDEENCRRHAQRTQGEIMNDQKWYAIDKHGVAIPCADQEEARNTAAEASALYPSCAPYRVAQLVALPETHVVAPREPSIAMVDAGVAMAMQVSASAPGGWSEYVRALYKQMINEIKENQ